MLVGSAHTVYTHKVWIAFDKHSLAQMTRSNLSERIQTLVILSCIMDVHGTLMARPNSNKRKHGYSFHARYTVGLSSVLHLYGSA